MHFVFAFRQRARVERENDRWLEVGSMLAAATVRSSSSCSSSSSSTVVVLVVDGSMSAVASEPQTDSGEPGGFFTFGHFDISSCPSAAWQDGNRD